MEGRGRKAVRIVTAALSVLTVVAAALVLEGVLAKDSSGRWPKFFGASAKSPLAATVTYVQKFTRCGDVTTSAVEMPRDELPGVLSALSGGWTVAESGDATAVVRKDTDGFCPDHEDFRLIALYRGGPADKSHICVFRGKKIDPAFIAKERRDLIEDTLYPQDRERLRMGVLVTREAADPSDIDLDEKASVYLQGIAEGR